MVDLQYIADAIQVVKKAKTLGEAQLAIEVLELQLKQSMEELPAEYTVQLIGSYSDRRNVIIQAIKTIRTYTSTGLKEVKDMVESTNTIISRTLPIDTANLLTKELNSVGVGARMYRTTAMGKVLFEDKKNA